MIETNTAVTSAITNINTELQIFQDQFLGIIQLVNTINNSLIETQIPLIISELSIQDIILINNSMINDLGNFSDLIIQRGKDILLLADQAQQFICVSNDAFDRVIDTWNWLTSRDMESTIINETNILKTEVINFRDLLNNRSGLISNEELIITQTLIDNKIIILRTMLDTITSTISNNILIFKKSGTATNVFKNVLAVNTTVGIALAVTQRAWDIMIRMNQHNYKTTSTVQDTVTTTATSAVLSTNTLYPVSMIEREKQINSWLNKMLIIPSLDSKIIVSGKIYRFSNKKDGNYIPEQLPDNYSTLSTPEILEQYNQSMQDIILPDILLEIVSKSALVQSIGIISHDMLITWYSLQVNPNFLLNDLITESESPNFITWYNKYLSTYVIQETIKNILLKKQKLQMRDTLLEHGIVSNYPQELKIENSSIYNLDGQVLTSGLQSQIGFQQFLNDKLIELFNSEQHLMNIDSIKGLYRNRLVPETGSGQFTLSQYSLDENGNEKLEKVIEQFKYSYLLYKDDLKIHYLEAKVNKQDYFLINNNLIQTSYTYSEDLAKIITFIETSVHQVDLLVQYNGYQVDFDYAAPIYKVLDMNINVEGIVEDKLNGIKKMLNTNYKNSLDNMGLNIITQIKDETDLETHWVTNNIIERVTTDITNIYRDELIKGNMDFTQARVNSIVSTLRFLGYREELDAYIDDTWLYGVPRYVAQP